MENYNKSNGAIQAVSANGSVMLIMKLLPNERAYWLILDEKMTSNNDNIIEALIVSSIIASFAIQLVFKEGTKGLRKQEKLSISFQRLSHVVVLLAQDFIKFLTLGHYFEKLKNKINLLSGEMFEKNHQHIDPRRCRIWIVN